ncbi:HNH endonuclease [Taibaiella soli]|uniref:HNH nuclease domain-containing protein n=1 Tax=Taibaiella soli TaxID=1649169 RepID=A0A2W2BGE8_9BACT|nr:HNH endonuclease [Taibaiella soli]PZF72576.1 hypothetical protein DN068_11975 [Taibaiella soli]
MLSAEQLWPIFLNNAKLYEVTGELFYSSKQKKPYQIIGTAQDVVWVRGGGAPKRIGKKQFKTCINNINNANNTLIPKRKIYVTIAEESAIVELLPMLCWANEGRYIYNEAFGNLGLNEKLNAESWIDDLNLKASREVTMRPWQRKLKDKLLNLYEGKCAITKCNIEQILQACHIKPFAENGGSISTNGLLLRADVHLLFDAHLISIQPESLTIHIHEKLNESEYSEYRGKALTMRNDNKALDSDALRYHWQKFKTKLES